MNTFRFSLLLLQRDSRAGELRLLLIALALAVAALTSVNFFADRVRQALERESHQLLGADLLLLADQPWPARFAEEARNRGLQQAQSQAFPSMVVNGDAAQLSEIKAVTETYPLRGRLRTTPSLHQPDSPTAGGPPPGQLWVDERLAAALAINTGEHLQVGKISLPVGAILTHEPDRGVNFFSVAPRLMMNLADLPATGLVQTGSRVNYRLLIAGEPEAINAFQRWATPQLDRGQRIEDTQNARPEIRNVMERAQKFLGLSSLLTVILAAVAVLLAARRYSQRHLDAVAVMRCLGATQGFLVRSHIWQFLLIGTLASLIGCLLGYGGHWILYFWLSEILAMHLPSASLTPALQGLGVGMVLLAGFALPPLLQLRHVPTLRVLRRELGTPAAGLLSAYTAGLAALLGMMFWIAGDWVLGSWVAGGFLAALIVFALLARSAVWLLSRLRGSAEAAGGFGWRFGLAGLERRALASTLQIVALALGMMALLLLTTTRGDLIDAWRKASPPDAPNRFVINIQPEQVAEVHRALTEQGIDAALAPMVRGRITRINEREVNAGDYEEDRARRLVEREFNLSWRADLPQGNRVVAGNWFGPADLGQGANVASVEEGLAKTLNIRLGDVLEFSVAGESVAVKVTSLRKLDWDSMRVNFFVLTPPAVLETYPASYITSFHLPEGQEKRINTLVREFPNLTVIDVAAILRQLQTILDQVALAVQFLFLLTLAVGIVVLYAALGAAFEERRYELAIMRSLGARREQLRRTLLTEFAATGALAGTIAAGGAFLVGKIIAGKVFQFEADISLWPLPLAIAGGAALVTLAGWLAVRRLLATSPLQVLRTGP